MSRAAPACNSIPGFGFRQSQRGDLRHERVRVMQAVAVVVDHDSVLGEQSNDLLVGLEKIVMGSLSLWPHRVGFETTTVR